MAVAKVFTMPDESIGTGIACCFLILLPPFCLSAVAQDAAQPSRRARFGVGYKVCDLGRQCNGPTKTLTVAVWYPTSANQRFDAPGDGTTSDHIVLDGDPYAEAGPYPLIVFSHGYGGSGLGAQFFAKQLVELGWIVVAPDHHDRYPVFRIRSGRQDVNPFTLTRHTDNIRKADADPIGRQMHFFYRLDEMKLTVDGMVASEDWGQLIDKDRIAVCGYSFGGFSALGLSGTIKQYHDLRVTAVLLFSRGAFGPSFGENLFRADELSAIAIPSMIVLIEHEAADRRGTKPVAESAASLYANLSAPKYLLVTKDADRSDRDFRDLYDLRCFCANEEQSNVIRRYAVAFLDKHVTGSRSADSVLEHEDPLLTKYEITRSVAEPASDIEKPEPPLPNRPESQ
jgi:predicted dienelactone hydrolase